MLIRSFIKRSFALLIAAAMLAISFPVTSKAASTLYVGPGETYTTIMAAYGAAASGDTIIVKDGTYYETATLSDYGVLKLTKDNITIRAENKWGAIIDAQNNPLYPYGVYFVNQYGYNGDNNVIDGFVIKNGAYGGIMVDADNSRILNSLIVDNGSVDQVPLVGQDGIYTYKRTAGTIISGNYILDNGRPSSNSRGRQYDHGIYICGDNEIISNNVIAWNAAMGIQVAGNANVTNGKIYNNTIVNNGNSGIIIWDGTPNSSSGYGVTNLEVKNNIFDGNGQRWVNANDGWGVAFYSSSGGSSYMTGTVISNNLFNANAGGTIMSGYTYTGSNNNSGDPDFVSGSTPYDISGSSPAVNAGATVTGVSSDFDGVSRPQGASFDIGAYEYEDEYVSPNLVLNPGFESGTANWNTSWGNTTVITNAGNAHSGSKFNRTGKGAGGIHQLINSGFAVGDTLTLSAWGMRTTTAVSGDVALDCLDSSGNALVTVHLNFTNSSWLKKSDTVTVPSGTTQLRVWTWKNNANSYFRVDDVSVTKN